MNGHCGKEAWVGGKPNHDWTGLEAPDAINFPQPSQMRSSDAKAATSHLKRAEGTFVKEAHRFKTGEDLDDPCVGLETHSRKHGMDTITHRNNPNEVTKNGVSIQLASAVHHQKHESTQRASGPQMQHT